MFGRQEYREINGNLNRQLEEKQVLIAVHRGTWGGNVIQNTIQAYRIALDMGGDIFECDAALSADGVFYAFHDGTEPINLGREENLTTLPSQEIDKLTGFTSGADDYVVKPFSVVELTARIDALYRRVWGNSFSTEIISSGPFELDTRSRSLKKDNIKIELTQVEYLIIKYFLENKGKALSRDDILKTVWGAEYQGDYKIVDVNIRRLRLKIEEDAALPKYISTVWGYGYKWET